MLGLITKGLQIFVEDLRGKAFWGRICAEQDILDPDFEALIDYDPALTNALIDSVSRELKISRHDLLEDFGTFITTNKEGGAIKNLLRLGGSSYAQFLRNLPDIPKIFAYALPNFILPRFSLREESPTSFTLEQSGTQGLGGVFLGVLRAMADEYQVLVIIEHVALENERGTHDRFSITLHGEQTL